MLQRRILFFALLLTFVLGGTSGAMAKVTPQQAEKLKKELNPLGGERAANADGTIPAWDGGLTAPPAGVTHKKGDFYKDPFADDKVLFTITAQNMAQYDDKLSEGLKALFKKYPDTFKINVYKTRRTQAAPQWFYENTFKNATRTALTDDGIGIVQTYGGVPFPIPLRGEEVIFNHLLRWQGGAMQGPQWTGLVTDGEFSDGGGLLLTQEFPVHYKSGSLETFKGIQAYILGEFISPARRKGEFSIIHDPLNQSTDHRRAWRYIPGQRRVRMAPYLAYDGSIPAYSGLVFFDEANGYFGAIDKYDWKLVGKKEMYIPYNDYKANRVPEKELLGKNHINPDVVRWELHRVWIVEANLKQGERHQYAKRLFYIDEDSWNAALRDNYDGHGNLWRTSYGLSLNAYDLPGVQQTLNTYHDLQRDDYGLQFTNRGESFYAYYEDKTFPMDKFTPEGMRRAGRR